MQRQSAWQTGCLCLQRSFQLGLKDKVGQILGMQLTQASVRSTIVYGVARRSEMGKKDVQLGGRNYMLRTVVGPSRGRMGRRGVTAAIKLDLENDH